MSAYTRKENQTNKHLADILSHGLLDGNGSGRKEKLASYTFSDLQRNGEFSKTRRETKSHGRNAHGNSSSICVLQKNGKDPLDESSTQNSSTKGKSCSATNRKEEEKPEKKEEEEDQTYEELICLVRQFYIERPVNPLAIGYHNIETC